jgi:hypothetical protein
MYAVQERIDRVQPAPGMFAALAISEGDADFAVEERNTGIYQ